MVKSDKKITTMYINKDIWSFCKKNKMNLSDWVNTEFTHQYLGLEAKKEEIKKIDIRKEVLSGEIGEMEKTLKTVSISLTDKEIRFIATVKPLVSKGCDHLAIHKRFNQENKREFTFPEFKDLVQLHEDHHQRRLEILKNKRKKR